MSLIVERVEKALRRSGGIDFAAVRRHALAKQPVDLASQSELAQRRNFLVQTAENPAAGAAAFERIIHGNELQDVNYLTRGARAARAIGRISIREPNGRLTGYGTAFLVGPNLLLTNHHVLPGIHWAQRSEVEFEYERDDDGRQLPGVKFLLDPGALFMTHEPLDFAVVAVPPRPTNAERDLHAFGFLPLVGGTGKAIEGEWLTIIQHPGGELKQLCVRENRLLQKGSDVLWYSTDTLGGSSGSPVFNNDWMVVALHHSGVPETRDGRWQTIAGQDFDERIHREEDIKWIANEGIRVSRIVETLRNTLGDHPLVQAALNVKISELSSQQTQNFPAPRVIAMNTPIPAPTSTIGGRKFLLTFDATGQPCISPYAAAAAESALMSWERGETARGRGVESRGVAFRFDDDYESRQGFDENFLGAGGGNGKYRVHLPELTPALAAAAQPLLPPNNNEHVLKYTNMSLVMHAKRRFAIYSAANVDFAHRYKALKSKRVWRYDPRIPLDVQIGDEAYEGNQFDRGHLTRQEDMEFGPTMADALQSTADTCHWTNCILQHQWFNRTTDWWQGIEQHILEHSIDPTKGKGFVAHVFTGPVFTKKDPEFPEVPDIKVPMKFWKVCAAVTSSGKLFAVAYLLDQSPVIKKHGLQEAAGEVPFEPYKLFQLPIAELQDMIHLKFTFGPAQNKKPLSNCDPLKDGTPPELDSDQDGRDDRLESAFTQPTTPAGWVNLKRHRPYFG